MSGVLCQLVEPRLRIRALRQALKLTQQDVADASDKKLDRMEVNKVENGRVGLASWATRKGFATAFGLTTDELSAYADGAIELADALQTIADRKSIAGIAARTPARRLRDRDEWTTESDEAKRLYPTVPPLFVDAVGALLDQVKYRLTAKLIGEIARSFYEADRQQFGGDSDEAVSTITGKAKSSK